MRRAVCNAVRYITPGCGRQLARKAFRRGAACDGEWAAKRRQNATRVGLGDGAAREGGVDGPVRPTNAPGAGLRQPLGRAGGGGGGGGGYERGKGAGGEEQFQI